MNTTIKNFLIKNWKTTLIGGALFTVTTLYVFDVIDTEKFLTITGFITGFGFLSSKDGDKTGLNVSADLGGGGIKNPNGDGK